MGDPSPAIAWHRRNKHPVPVMLYPNGLWADINGHILANQNEVQQMTDSEVEQWVYRKEDGHTYFSYRHELLLGILFFTLSLGFGSMWLFRIDYAAHPQYSTLALYGMVVYSAAALSFFITPDTHKL